MSEDRFRAFSGASPRVLFGKRQKGKQSTMRTIKALVIRQYHCRRDVNGTPVNEPDDRKNPLVSLGQRRGDSLYKESQFHCLP
jgi:hypothetical protein